MWVSVRVEKNSDTLSLYSFLPINDKNGKCKTTINYSFLLTLGRGDGVGDQGTCHILIIVVYCIIMDEEFQARAETHN